MARQRDYAAVRQEIDEAMERTREAQEDVSTHQRAMSRHEAALKTLQKQEEYLKDRGGVPEELDRQIHDHIQQSVAHAGPLAEAQDRLQRAGEDISRLQDEVSAIVVQPEPSQAYGYGISALQRFQSGLRRPSIDVNGPVEPARPHGPGTGSAEKG